MEKKQQHTAHKNSNLSFFHCERTKPQKGELGKSRAFRMQTNRRQRAPKTQSNLPERLRERERERERIPLFIFYTSKKEIYTRN
jgi:hypothetical protein